MPAQPQDHQPKAAPFKFKGADGKNYTLPLASKGRAKLSGRDLRDAVMGGEIGQMAYLFKVLEAAGASSAALDALYDLPGDKTQTILAEWANHGDGDGASLGE
jgi:hypothetical protein